MTPSITSGVHSIVLPARLSGVLYRHATVSFDTFWRVIPSSGEKRVPPLSLNTLGQSVAVWPSAERSNDKMTIGEIAHHIHRARPPMSVLRRNSPNYPQPLAYRHTRVRRD